MELSETSRDAQDRHALLLQRVEAERRARAIVVPTQVKDVREKLRDLGHAVRLFGENDADVRERLRLLLARIETSGEAAAHADAPSAMTHLFHPMLVPTPTQPQRQGDMPADANGAPSAAADEASAAAAAQEALKSDVYTRASAELVAARGAIASLSFARSTERLATLRRRYSDVEQLNRETHRQYCAIMVRATRRPHCPRPPDLVILPTPPLPPFPPNHAPSPFSLSLSLSLCTHLHAHLRNLELSSRSSATSGRSLLFVGLPGSTAACSRAVGGRGLSKLGALETPRRLSASSGIESVSAQSRGNRCPATATPLRARPRRRASRIVMVTSPWTRTPRRRRRRRA